MALRAIDDKIIVKRDDPEKKAGAIIAPASAKAQKDTLTATVLAVGPGRMLESGIRNPMDVKVGDRVLIGHPPTAVRVNGEIFHIIESIDVVCILDASDSLDAFQ